MTASSPFRRFAFVFGATFAVFYVIALAKDLALFTVFPSLGIVLAGTHHSRDVADPAMGFLAPAMYWYGWAATAALGASAFGLVTRTVDATVLDRMGMVGSRALNDRVRLSHTALVSPMTGLQRPKSRPSRASGDTAAACQSCGSRRTRRAMLCGASVRSSGASTSA
jgi:hypothetical protein